MLKPYTRQQIQTDKVLSSISNIHEKNILEQILAHKNTLYNIIPITQYNIPLKDIPLPTDIKAIPAGAAGGNTNEITAPTTIQLIPTVDTAIDNLSAKLF